MFLLCVSTLVSVFMWLKSHYSINFALSLNILEPNSNLVVGNRYEISQVPMKKYSQVISLLVQQYKGSQQCHHLATSVTGWGSLWDPLSICENVRFQIYRSISLPKCIEGCSCSKNIFRLKAFDECCSRLPDLADAASEHDMPKLRCTSAKGAAIPFSLTNSFTFLLTIINEIIFSYLVNHVW